MKQKVLAIDQSKAIRFLLQTVLARDYDVVTASDGCSAMSWLAKKNLPGVIIADPQLPDMKDWELIDFLSASALYRHIPVMVLSDMDINELHHKCKKFNIVQFFQKPFNPVSLVKAVATTLNETNANKSLLNQHSEF